VRDAIKLVEDVIAGRLPRRAPMFDLLRNDAVIEHFAGQELTVEKAPEIIPPVYPKAIDVTRSVRMPDAPSETILEDGRQQKVYRWTMWTEHMRYENSDAYAKAKKDRIDAYDPAWDAESQRMMDEEWAGNRRQQEQFGDECYWMPCGAGVNLMTAFGEVGLEQFSYYLADCSDLIDELLEVQTLDAVRWVSHYPDDHGVAAMMMGDDIAFKSGPIFSPAWFEEHYFHRLARVIEAYHEKGIKVMFHSDGNIMPILDQLVEAGIDGLNPLEVMAGVNIKAIHKRYPHLFMTGGVDVSELLPFGTPEQVFEKTRETIYDGGGRLMIGSSTELQNCVPLENFMAMRRAVLYTPYY
jgi:hypothetical protein